MYGVCVDVVGTNQEVFTQPAERGHDGGMGGVSCVYVLVGGNIHWKMNDKKMCQSFVGLIRHTLKKASRERGKKIGGPFVRVGSGSCSGAASQTDTNPHIHFRNERKINTDRVFLV